MHDIDRTLGQESTDFELDGMGFEADFETEADFEAELFGEVGELTEEAEIDLAAELLSVTNEQELDQFIGNLVRRIGSGVARFARSPMGRHLAAC